MLGSGDVGDLLSVQTNVKNAVHEAATEDSPVLIEAPPASGKTKSAYELATELDQPVTYLAGRTDLYDDAETWCEDHTEDITWEKIPAPHRNCDTFDGKYGDDVAAAVKRLYAKGMSGRRIHNTSSEDFMPCLPDCSYFETVNRLDKDVGEIDLLIGHHSHCRRHQYIRNRIVVLDEFNPDPFQERFPSESGSSIIDEPGALVRAFLEAVHDTETTSPLDEVDDVTDIIRRRRDADFRSEALEWLLDQGVSRSEVEAFDWFEASTYPYNETHFRAPLLTFGLLSMEKIGPGFELASAASNAGGDYWDRTSLSPGTRILRDRNTSVMYTLEPPDLDPATQVIGLDATPTIELWNLLFSPNNGFDHRQIISRDDMATYLDSALNISLVQLGNSMHYYAGGRVSEYDQHRFTAVTTRENEQIALITTKKALRNYERRGWLDGVVKPWGGDAELTADNLAATNYGHVLSSNVFAEEPLGAVFGAPFPSDDVVVVWAGLCGEVVSSEGTGEDKTFGHFGDKVFEHFAHKQVVQAIFRFGRHPSVWEDGGATVYVSTKALPSWFDIDEGLEIRSNKKENAVIRYLIDVAHDGENGNRYQSAPEVATTVSELAWDDDSITSKATRKVLKDLTERDVATCQRNANTAFYRWAGDDHLAQVDGAEWVLVTDDRIYVFEQTEWAGSSR